MLCYADKKSGDADRGITKQVFVMNNAMGKPQSSFQLLLHATRPRYHARSSQFVILESFGIPVLCIGLGITPIELCGLTAK